MAKENVIVDKTFEFALEIVRLAEELGEGRRYVIANQVLKSGTSVGANVREAQNSESRADFIHKMKLAAKEAEETEYWLLLCKHSKNHPDTDELLKELETIKKIISRIISTAKTNAK